MPRKGLVGILGAGVGIAAEYNAHRKEQKKLSRENSQQGNINDQPTAGPSTRPQQASRGLSSSSDLPPSYDDVVEGRSDRSLATGGPPAGDKKAAMRQYSDEKTDPFAEKGNEDSSSSDDFLENDEEIWDLDEAVDRESGTLSPEPSAPSTQNNRDAWALEVITSYRTTLAAAGPSFQPSPLPCPVIIPQRRPRSKARGFVRAYAPYLGECSGISQETFLLFLENFQKSSQASSAITVIQVSAMIAGFAPSVIAMAVTTAVQIAAGTAKEIQSRQRTNNFLDRMNEDMFKPAGLYAMIVKYKSDDEVRASGNSLLARFGVSGEKVDLSTNETIAKYNRSLSEESTGGMSERLKNMRFASGTTKGAMQLPEAAPLIFPQIDKRVAIEGEETFKDKAKDAQGFLQDYMDRRAQVKYASADPQSNLNVPEDQRAFRSKLADPNHPMYNGGLIGFVSGGHLSGNRGSYGGRDQKSWNKDDRRMLKYEQRLDEGRGLSRKKERRYENILAYRSGYEDDGEEYYDRGMYGRGAGRGRGGLLGGLGGGDGYGRSSSYEGGRRRRGGLISGLVGAAASAMQSREGDQERSREYEDSYNSRLSPGYDDPRMQRRSFDEREARPGGPAPHAPYGGQQAADPYAARGPSPYGGDGHAPYGGQPSYSRGYSDSSQRQGAYPPRRQKQQSGGILGTVRKVMTQDVIYLIIVNMPSEEELAEARQALAAAKAGR